MVMAVSGRRIRTGGSDGMRCIGWPGFCRAITSRGFTIMPPLAIAAPASASCSEVTLTSWPMASDPIELGIHCFTSPQVAARFSRQLDSGLLAESELPLVFVERPYRRPSDRS